MGDFYCDEVLSGRLPVTVLFESDDVLAFEHTRPAYAHHVVVIPKQHVADLLDADDAVLLLLLAAVRHQAQRLLDTHGACRVITNLGDYQDSKHLHWHVVSGDRTA